MCVLCLQIGKGWDRLHIVCSVRHIRYGIAVQNVSQFGTICSIIWEMCTNVAVLCHKRKCEIYQNMCSVSCFCYANICLLWNADYIYNAFMIIVVIIRSEMFSMFITDCMLLKGKIQCAHFVFLLTSIIISLYLPIQILFPCQSS